MLEGAVLAFRLFANDDKVKVTVARLQTRKRVDANHVGEQVDGFTQSHVTRVGVWGRRRHGDDACKRCERAGGGEGQGGGTGTRVTKRTHS